MSMVLDQKEDGDNIAEYVELLHLIHARYSTVLLNLMISIKMFVKILKLMAGRLMKEVCENGGIEKAEQMISASI